LRIPRDDGGLDGGDEMLFDLGFHAADRYQEIPPSSATSLFLLCLPCYGEKRTSEMMQILKRDMYYRKPMER